MAIIEALQLTGIKPITMENFSATSHSQSDFLQDQIKTANFVIADITGGNPWVLYEVGAAHAMQKPVLLVAQDLNSIPAPLTGYLIFVYEPNNLARLQAAVTSWTQRFIGRDSRHARDNSYAG
jgi:hypothetical protein